MTEKVKVPQTIANVIESMRRKNKSNYEIIVLMNRPDREIGYTAIEVIKKWLLENGHDVDLLLEVLVNGYEIEPEPLKVGDWAKYENSITRLTSKIHEIKNGNRAWGHWHDGSETYSFIYLDELVKMTPEEIERQKWAGIEPGDVLIGTKSGTLAVLVMNLPEHSEVQVRVRNHDFQTWDKASVELYAKKVGAIND